MDTEPPAPAATAAAPRKGLKRLRLVLWLLVLVVAAGFAWLATREPVRWSQEVPSGTGFTIGAPFTLTGTDGRPFSSRALAGKPHAIFFGFTNCPDVCPNTLGRLAKLRKELGASAETLPIVFIAVDAERDTPAAVKEYLTLFGTPIIGLTGTEAQLAKVAKDHAVYLKKAPDAASEGGYTMEHSSQVLLFGKDGKFAATIALDETDPPALAKLKRILA